MMAEFWRNISERERFALVVGASFVVLALIYALIVHPLQVNYARYGKEIRKKEQLLVWMRESAREVQKLAASGKSVAAVGTGSPLALVDRTARRFSLASGLKRVEPVDNNGVKVWLEGVLFADVISWARVLETKYAVEIDAVSFDTPQDAGIVNARITFRRRGL